HEGLGLEVFRELGAAALVRLLLGLVGAGRVALEQRPDAVGAGALVGDELAVVPRRAELHRLAGLGLEALRVGLGVFLRLLGLVFLVLRELLFRALGGGVLPLAGGERDGGGGGGEEAHGAADDRSPRHG